MTALYLFGFKLIAVCGAIAGLIWLLVYWLGKKFPIEKGYVDYLDENAQTGLKAAERAWQLKRRAEYAVLVVRDEVSTNERRVIERIVELRKQGVGATVRVIWKKQSGRTHFWLQVRRADQTIEDPTGPAMANNPNSTG